MSPQQGPDLHGPQGSAERPQSTARRRLLQGGAAAAPVILSVVASPVRAAGMTVTASAMGSINASTSAMTYVTTGMKPSSWLNVRVKDWPEISRVSNNHSKAFKEIFQADADFGDMSLEDCLKLSGDMGTNGLVKHLAAAYLNAVSGRTPAVVAGVPILRDIWASYRGPRGFYEPTAGVKWFADTCSPAGNGGCTPWLKTTMPL